MMSKEPKEGKKKLGLWIGIGAAVAAAGITLAILIPNLAKQKPAETPGTSTEDVVSSTETPETKANPIADGTDYDGDLYWNVDRLEFAGKSETGMSSRTVEKEDGYYHLTFAVNGRQVERRCKDKRIVNIIDTQDLIGLTFDESGIIDGVIPLNKLIEEFAIEGLYIKEVMEDGEFELNTSETLKARKQIFMNLKGTKVYDVSGLTQNFVGLEIGYTGLMKHDRIFGVEWKGETLVYVTDRFIDIPVYWNITRKYDNATQATTREPNAQGEYEYLMALRGEHVTVKTKSRDVASAIDKQTAHCQCFEFDEAGYVIRVWSPARYLKGSTFASWAHVTEVSGPLVKAIKLSGSNKGQTYEGSLSDEVEIYDCSSSAEMVGMKVDKIQVTDQIHGLTDSTGKIKIVFIVARLIDSPVYWNVPRTYDSKTATTTRTPDANGWYVYDMRVEAKQITLRTKDKEVADLVDSYSSKCMGLVLDGDVILKAVSGTKVMRTGGGTAASWHDIISMKSATEFHAKKTTKSASDYGHEEDVIVAENCEIYNVSSNYAGMIGEKTTLRVGDRVHCLKNLEGEAAVIFVVNRPVASPVYWNMNRKYDTKTGQTTRKPDADGWYVFKMAVEGKQVELKTKDVSIATEIDSKSSKCVGLTLNGDVIVKVHTSTAVVNCTGGTVASWYTVTSVSSSGKFHAKKLSTGASDYGKEVDVEPAADCKIWNVGGLYEYCGEPTKVKVGDVVHGFLNNDGKASTIFVVTRKAPDIEATCPDCGKKVKWTGFTGTLTAEKGQTVHYYLASNVKLSTVAYVPEGSTVHLDMNGFNLTTPERNRAVTTWLDGSNLVIMNQKKSSTSTIIADGGTPGGDYGALMWVRFATSTLTIRDITIDGSKVDFDVTRSLIYGGKGKLNLKNVKIIGAKHLNECSAIYVNNETTLENVTVTGGTASSGGSVVVTKNGKLTVKGKFEVSGGKLDDGQTANLYVAGGNTITISGLTSGKGTIGIRLEQAGTFTGDGNEAYLDCFVSDAPSGTVGKTDAGALNWDYEVTGIGVRFTELTVPAGESADPAPYLIPGPKDGVTFSYSVADPTYVEITKTGEILGVRDSGGKKTAVTVTDSLGHSAVVQVIVTAPENTDHYHREGTHAEILSGSGTKVAYQPWEKTDALPTESGYYYLVNDVVVTGAKQPTVSAGQHVHLCLNGHTVRNETEGHFQTYDALRENSSLSITDCSSDESGALIATGSKDIQGRLIWVLKGATVNLYAGNFVGAESTKVGGGTLCVEPGGTINMYGGTVKGGSSTVVGGNVNVRGTFNLYGGTITGGQAPNGANVYVDTGAVLNTFGGTIEAGNASGGGGNVYAKAATLNLKNTVLRNGTAADAGGNIFLYKSNLVLDGTSVSGGTAGTLSKGNVFINGPEATVRIQNLETEGGFLITNVASLTLSGRLLIGSASRTGLHIQNTADYSQNIVAENLSADSKIWLNASNVGVLIRNSAAYLARFDQTKGADYTLKANGQDIELAVRTHDHSLSGGHIPAGTVFRDGTAFTGEVVTWQKWSSTTSLPVYGDMAVGNNYYYLENDVTLATAWRIGLESSSASTKTYVADMGGRKMFLCLNGHTITNKGSVFVSSLATTSPNTYTKNIDITITDCQATAGKVLVTTTTGDLPAFFWIEGTGSSITLYNGVFDASSCKIGGSLKNLRGSTFRLTNASKLTMYGGTVLGAEMTGATEYDYGGIYVGSGCSFTMYGGEVSGGRMSTTSTTVKGFGGNIYAAGTVALYGGTVKNGVAITNGGNIFMDNNSTLIMDGATVQGGSAGGVGGSIALKGTSTIRNSVIEGGTTTDAGGNISFSAGSATIENTIIRNGTGATELKSDCFVNNANVTIQFTDVTLDGSFQVMNVKSLMLAGETKIGSETKTGLYIQNSSSYAPNVVAGSLSAGSKIYLSASKTGKVVTGGAAYIDLFEQKKGDGYKLEANGEDLDLVEN